MPVLLQPLSLVPPHLLPHLLESLQVLASGDLHFLNKALGEREEKYFTRTRDVPVYNC